MRRFCAIALVLSSACQGGQTQLASPAPVTAAGELAGTLAQVRQEARDGRYAAADKLLTDFSARYPSAPEASEVAYWRALYKLDPANQAGSAHEAAALLDSYLAGGPTVHRAEAGTLRRLASSLESYSASLSSAQKIEPAKIDDKTKDEELARLKDELAKANAELDRIKRRLAQPKP
jgi:hypothetical protein